MIVALIDGSFVIDPTVTEYVELTEYEGVPVSSWLRLFQVTVTEYELLSASVLVKSCVTVFALTVTVVETLMDCDTELEAVVERDADTVRGSLERVRDSDGSLDMELEVDNDDDGVALTEAICCENVLETLSVIDDECDVLGSGVLDAVGVDDVDTEFVRLNV